MYHQSRQKLSIAEIVPEMLGVSILKLCQKTHPVKVKEMNIAIERESIFVHRSAVRWMRLRVLSLFAPVK